MSNKIQLYTNIAKLYTLSGGVAIQEQLEDVKIIKDAWMTVKADKILAIGEATHPFQSDEEVDIIDLHQQIVLPGFIDSHTHLVYGGSRSNEYQMKISGVPYLDILKAGGGIFASVNATRLASFEALYEKAYDTATYMLSCGVTTLEAKSGYGLDKECELKQLRVVKKLNEKLPIDFISTFLPAHAMPKEFTSPSAYFSYVKDEVLPIVMEEKLASFMDCFLETGVFSAKEAKEILTYGQNAGLKIKIHVDEIASIGGIPLACEMNATSVEHCMVTTKADMKNLANHKITTILLPATSFNLGSAYAHAREMIEQGVILALASDYNPGSCPCSDMLWMQRIASRGLKLTPNQVLSMVTINAAHALELDESIGSLIPNKQADFIVMNVDSFDEVIATMCKNPISAVYKNGRKVV
ncbi:MAG: imidazolonepropionase [Erysipelotrichaceae bacterium]